MNIKIKNPTEFQHILNMETEIKLKWKEIYDQNPYSEKLKYDLFYPKASIYSDICTPLTNTIITGRDKNKISITKMLDVSIFQRKKYIGIDGDTMNAKCQCDFTFYELIDLGAPNELEPNQFVKIEYDTKKF
ncbi:MAG: hypothetical protein HUJ93_04815, partial [Bacteroidales bacterium]|nr:hypothetical protein [Bacteroidales bacterium]